MAKVLTKAEQNTKKSSQLTDCKQDDGRRNLLTDQSHPLTNAEGTQQDGDGNYRRSLLPKKTAPSSSRSTGGSQKKTQHTSTSTAIPESNLQAVPDPFPNSSMRKKHIHPEALEEEESASGSKAQVLPGRKVERSFSTRRRETASRSQPASRISHHKNVRAPSGPQLASSVEVGTASVSVKRVSSSASNVGSIGSETSISGINNMDHTAARPRIKSGYQSAQPSAGGFGHNRTSSHQIATNSIPEGRTLRPKDASVQHVPVRGHRPPLSTLMPDAAPGKSSRSTAPSSFAQSTGMGAEPEMSPKQILYLQMELLQLCILHRSAIETKKQWEQSAERKLRHRFDVLRKEHIRIKGFVQAQKALENQAALVAWSRNMTSTELAAKVQLLSRNIMEMWQLTSYEGDYTRIVRQFKVWFDRARSIQGSRKQPTQSTGQDIEFIDSIEDGWALEVEAMEQKFTTSLHELRSIGEVPENTDFGQLLFSFKKLASNPLEEMGLIRAIYTDIMAYEESWIQTRADDIIQAGDHHTKPLSNETYRGIWEGPPS